MAEVGIALLTVVFDNIFNKLGSLFRNEFRLIQGGLSEDLDRLSTTLSKFKHVLRDAEVKDFKSAATTDWLRRLKYAANEADGILDDAMDSDSDSDDDNQTRVCQPFPPFINFNRVEIRHNLAERIRSVTQKFDLLDSERSTLDFSEIHMNRETTSTLSKPKVFGRNEAKEKIIQALLNVQTGGPPFVYAIVGLGGIGKTTLAQLIYNDEKVVENFDPRLWVWISQNFDVNTVMRNLIETLSKEACQLKSLEAMQTKLKELLNGRKFFIVLDDVWISNKDLGEWNSFKSVLECGAIGSSVILTTRQSDVASLAGSHDRHNIALLSEDQSWFLFKESSFLEGNQENGELEVTGKQIVRKCGGMPLAVKNLGGSLRSTRVVREWESVRDSQIWELSCDILPALKLSLIRLESHSRDCFAFSSIFPKGYEMSKEKLIHLWMANDLVPLHGRLEIEDMGNQIFNELVLKSFFQISYNSVVTMHDLMHDLGRSFRDECFCLEGRDVSMVPPHILQLSITHHDSLAPDILETLFKSHPSLRTCILLNKSTFSTNEIIFKNLDCLRALSLKGIRMDNLPLSIGKSKHLKYLNLSWTYLRRLPETICTLTKLQTLILFGCWELTHLPDGIGQLINLRHLDLSWCKELTHLPVGISQLTNLRHVNLYKCNKLTQLPSGMGKLVYLRTLGKFIVGRESGQRITELQGLNHLEGSLEIRGLEHVRDASEAREAVLKEKKNVSSLSLNWGDFQGSNSTSDEAEGVLEALEPPQSLSRELAIEGYGGSVFPASWIKLLDSDGCTGSNNNGSERRRIFTCPRLECMRLSNCPALRSLPLMGSSLVKMHIYKCQSLISLSQSLRDLSTLESLHVSNCDQLEFSVDDFQNLNSLKWLTFESLPRVTSLPNLQYLSTLGELKIYDCNNLIRLWPQGMQNLRVLKTLTVGRCEQLELSTGDFQHLQSLESLDISNCENLKTLPPGLQNLTSLQRLEIVRCHPDLHLQCEEDKGEYWPFISHIQQIHIRKTRWRPFGQSKQWRKAPFQERREKLHVEQ